MQPFATFTAGSVQLNFGSLWTAAAFVLLSGC